MPSETLTKLREHRIGHLDDIPRGEGRTFELAERRVAVFRTQADEVFASQAECPHLQGPLADGMLGGTVIMCPLHDRSYDLRSGKALAGEGDLKVYDVRRLADGALLLTVEG
ncbi:MAG: nitrite reductase small subunit NirD [Acetobacteraceae bacterium]